MRAFRLRKGICLGLTMAVACFPCAALDKPTGAPLILSSTETEQPIPLVFLDADGKTAKFVALKLHWNPITQVGPNDDATSFSLDLPADSPGAPIFTAQLWNASLASALAWQQPWQGARWKIIQTPVTDGTGIDAALAVGMIATAARRPYPEKTVIIGSLNPDGSLGPVSRLPERMKAAAAAGMTRVIIPGVQRFDTDPSGQVINMVKQAGELKLECVPVDNLIQATETAMNDPLPEVTVGSTTPKYSNEVAGFIEDFANREQNETTASLKFAPKETEISKFPPRTAALWKSIFADYAAGQQAYRAGQVYIAYRLFSRANAGMSGVNALIGQNRANFDVKAALTQADDLRNHLRTLMNPPAMDKGELQSAVLVAEMADWAYDINATLEGAQLVTKQAYSQRSDATAAQKDRARESLVFAIEQGKYLLNQADFFNKLAAHIGKNGPVKVDENAAHLLPQLLPAQLAVAQVFAEGIRPRAGDMRDGLLFDSRLAAYVNTMRAEKADWDAAQRKKEMEAEAAAVAPPPTAPGEAPKAAPPTTLVAFDPADTYRPPHTVIASAAQAKKLSDAALCTIWANTDCEIAVLDEKYLRLSGTIDPATHEWHVKDRAKLDALLQASELGARQGIAFAEKAEVDTSVLAMIYEKAAYNRIQEDDLSALEALRHYWRCALIGNLCWQLAHNRKAQPVDIDGPPAPDAKPGDNATPPTDDAKTPDVVNTGETPAGSVDNPKPPTVAKAADKPQPKTPNAGTKGGRTAPAPVAGPVVKPTPVAADNAPRAQPVTADEAAAAPREPAPAPAPVATPVVAPVPAPVPAPVAGPVVTPTPAPVAAPATNPAVNEENIPVAPIAKVEDYSGTTTNAPPVVGPIPPSTKDNADGHGGF